MIKLEENQKLTQIQNWFLVLKMELDLREPKLTQKSTNYT